MKKRLFSFLLVLLLCGSLALSVSADIADPTPSVDFIEDLSAIQWDTILLILAIVLAVSVVALVLILVLVKKKKASQQS